MKHFVERLPAVGSVLLICIASLAAAAKPAAADSNSINPPQPVVQQIAPGAQSAIPGSVSASATANEANANGANPEAAPTPALQNAPPATQEITNPYGLSSLWEQGDFIARGTLLILAIMSASTWYILVTS